MSVITKAAENVCRFRRRSFAFDNARSAWRAYLQFAGITRDDEVLLPAYIGRSSREGSGVFDPIIELGVKYSFYRLSQRLEIDSEDVRAKIRARRPKLLLLIHYFGFPDSALEELCEFAHANGILAVEDEAHAMLSDQVGGVCGRAADAAIYSLHKLLPVTCGGELVLNRCQLSGDSDLLSSNAVSGTFSYHDYDLAGIARRRRDNATFLLKLLESADLPVESLYQRIPPGVVPQSVPIVITATNRDDVYCKMNAAGYGVVSLYHTLVSQICANEFPASHFLARHIMNLPVHQDIDPEGLAELVDCMSKLVKA